jgi:hypothetical protein
VAASSSRTLTSSVERSLPSSSVAIAIAPAPSLSSPSLLVLVLVLVLRMWWRAWASAWSWVYVSDEKRGRQALLWNHHYGPEEFECVDVPPDHPIRPHLPEGSRIVRQAQALPIYSPALPFHPLHAGLCFSVSPEAGQEGVAEADKLWRMARGDEHSSLCGLLFRDDVVKVQLASFIRGLLEPTWS